jgi:hypothetical protein
VTRGLVAITVLILLAASGAFAQAPDSVRGAASAVPPASRPQGYANLGIRLDARFEMRFDRLRNLRCTAADATRLTTGCRGGFTPPRFAPLFSVRTGGVVGERVHVNVDYDTEREFEASNNIRVFYQGREGEILRRVQVGNVTFTAPNSRFITGGIPANNFGVQLEGRVGALDWSAILAQQKGNVVRGRTFTIGDRTVQPLYRDLVDRDFEPLRFFFVQDPATLPGYPAVDVLDLNLAALPAEQRVTEVRIYRRRSTLGRTTADPLQGGIEAVALRSDGPQRAGPFAWELLIESRDYYLDPSGLWFALRSRLDQNDYLAVSYVVAAGDTVGTFPAAAVAGREDTLRLISEPRRGPEVPTFRYEMRNAYRVGSGDDVVRESVRLDVLVSESERPAQGGTFLALLGLAQQSDPTSFDHYNRLFPRERDPSRGEPVRDVFVVFPHLTPFADRATLPPQFRNDSLYRTPTYLLRTQGPTPLFVLRLRYDARGGEDRSLLSLGGIQIREGSERISAGGRLLVRDRDYTVNYEIGQVTFLAPDSLFRQPTQVSVRYEENPAFAIAPTSIYALRAGYDFGDHGAVTMLGLLQRERTTFTRPPLGFEPSSNFVGGVSANFRFEPQRLTRLLDALPFVATEAPSFVTLDAELATSRPSPNQAGVAYVETFEGEGGTFLPLDERFWEYGSRPASGSGLAGTGVDPAAGFADDDAVPLTWQNLVTPVGGVAQFRARDIDPSIRVQGAGENAETVLWLALYPDTAGGLPELATGRPRWLLPHTPGPRWRSIAQPLSSTGLDLSRVEFLEFWVFEETGRPAGDDGAALVFDFGTVFEDGVAFQPLRFQVTAEGDTIFSGRRRAGEGRLDSERDSLTNTFNAVLDDNGIHGAVADSIVNAETGAVEREVALCRSELARRLVVYDWGDLHAACTRRNGAADTEDLDGDRHLDTLIASASENFIRFVFRLGDETYHVRDGGTVTGAAPASGGQWRLYRIPFRSPTAQEGFPDLRQIRALRLVLTAPAAASERLVRFALARLKLVAAPWVKRAGTPIAGLAGGAGAPHGEVVASVVSTENGADLGYEPPPGVVDEGEIRGGEFQLGAREINERSLRLVGSDVRAGERAEAFARFPEGERNFLGYRQLRVWARGRGPGWDEGELAFYVKVAQDEHNFYLYRTAARTTTWEPEVVVDFHRWLALRARIEARYLGGLPPDGAAATACGAHSLAYVACDSLYLVHVRDPGVAPPNLSRVQELAVGFIRNRGAPRDSVELWVDDIRLTQVVKDAGFAGALNLHVVAADVADVSLALSRRDAQFRQLDEDPSYVTTDQLALAATIRLERLGLERLGISAPLAFRTERSALEPFFLSRTDVLAEGLTDLRRPRTTTSTYSAVVRRSRRGTRWWQRALVDNLTVSASLADASSATALSKAGSRRLDVRGDYLVLPAERTMSYVPGVLRRALRGLPGFLRRTELVRGLEDGRLRWTPAQIQLSSGFRRSRGERQTFRSPIVTAADTLTPPVVSLMEALRSVARFEARPFRSATVSFDLTSDRDLRDYGDATIIGVLARQSAGEVLGLDVGFERARSLATRIAYAPPLVSWLRPRLTATSTFGLARDPNSRTPEPAAGDSGDALRLPSAFANTRSVDIGGALELSRALRGVLGASSPLVRVLDRVSQLDFATRSDRRSQFDRAGFDPGTAYQLGLGGAGAFRRQRDRPASAASESRQTRLASGLRLPLNFSITSSYAERRIVTWALRSGGQQQLLTTETEWPDVTGRWTWTPRHRLIRRALLGVSATAAVRVRESQTVQPPLRAATGGAMSRPADVRGSQETRSRPVALSLSWAPRLVTNLSVGDERVRTDRSGIVTLYDRRLTSADLSFAFRAPPGLLRLPSEVRTSLRYLRSANKGCVRRAGSAGCVPTADSERREYHLTMDTDMPPNVSAAFALSYVLTEDAQVNRRFSQFIVTATVSVSFAAGEIR